MNFASRPLSIRTRAAVARRTATVFRFTSRRGSRGASARRGEGRTRASVPRSCRRSRHSTRRSAARGPCRGCRRRGSWTSPYQAPAGRAAPWRGTGIAASRTRFRCFIFRASSAAAMIEQHRYGRRHFQRGEAPMPTHAVPTYEDAQLVLKLYELRREEKLRAARDWFGGKFFPQTAEDVIALTGTENAYYRMVTTYWEMAASFVARGVLNADLFLDSGGEMIFVWTKLADLVPQLRQNLGSENLLKHVES